MDKEKIDQKILDALAGGSGVNVIDPEKEYVFVHKDTGQRTSAMTYEEFKAHREESKLDTLAFGKGVGDEKWTACDPKFFPTF